MLASLATLALVAIAPVVAAPNVERRFQYNLLNNGTKGTVEGQADDFDATYHASAFLSRGGCSTTAQITQCYTADLAADPKKELETKDYSPYIVGGVGANQRALLLSETHRNTSGVVTHTVRFHISTTYTDVQVGPDHAVTLVGLRNFGAGVGLKALDVRARQFIGEETSGKVLYVAVVSQDGSEQFPEEFTLADAVGKTVEVTYKLGVNGATVDADKFYVAEVSAKFVSNGEKLFDTGVPKSLFPKGAVDPSAHRLIFGADRKAFAGQKELKVWFGDYSVTPLPISTPE